MRDDPNGATASRKCMATYGRCYVFHQTTGRKQVKAVLIPSFLEDGPTHDALLYATRKQIEEVIVP